MKNPPVDLSTGQVPPHNYEGKYLELPLKGDEYSQLAGLASNICDTPISFLFREGNDCFELELKGDISISNIALNEAFYARTLALKGQVYQVQDARVEDSLASNPLKADGMDLVFYAGVAILDGAGQAIGAIGVADIVPRELTKQQCDGLTSLVQLGTSMANKEKLYTRYRNFFESTSDMIYEVDGEGKLLFTNDTLRKLLGYTSEELKGMPYWSLVPPSYEKQIKKYYQDIVKNDEKSTYHELPVLAKDGTRVWLGQSVDFVRKHGELHRAYVIAKDISKHRADSLEKDKYSEGLRMLNQLGASAEKSVSTKIKEGLQLCTQFLNLELGIVSNISGNDYRILEYHPEDAGLQRGQTFHLGQTYCDIAVHKDRPISINNMGMSEYAAHPCYSNFGLESYLGSSYEVNGVKMGTVNFTSTLPREEKFTIYDIDFISLVADWIGRLIERDEARKRLEEERKSLEAFVKNAPAAIAMFDKDLCYMAASERWYKDYALQSDVLGKSHYEVFPEIKDEWKEIHKRCLMGEVAKSDEDEFERQDGTKQWIRWEVRPWYTADNRIGGLMMHTEDITLLKYQSEELKKAKEEAEVSAQAKENFLSTMSHEIRTPLNAIIGTTKLLELEQPALVDNERFSLLKFSSANLLSLINDVLDFNKIESGKFELDNHAFDLSQLLHDIVGSWLPSAEAKSILVHLSIPSNESFGVNADALRISQVFNNLISNAIKFTKSGGTVSVNVVKEYLGEIQSGYRITVQDTGIGIPHEKIEVIFESFLQLRSSEVVDANGTGLGLAIVKRIVEFMDGNIHVTSQEGLGSKFEVFLPLERVGLKHHFLESIEQRAPALDQVNILLVEDNRANQAIALGFLEQWGIGVEIANDGIEGLQRIKDGRYDLVLMDLRMPKMDGYQCAHHIRQMSGEYFQKLPILAVTASTMSDVRKKIQEAGMTDYVSKPFDPKLLFDKICQYAGVEETRFLEPVFEDQYPTLYAIVGDQKKAQKILMLSLETLEEGLDEIAACDVYDGESECIRDAIHKMKPHLTYLENPGLVDRLASCTTTGQGNGSFKDWKQAVRDEVKNTRKMIMSTHNTK